VFAEPTFGSGGVNVARPLVPVHVVPAAAPTAPPLPTTVIAVAMAS